MNHQEWQSEMGSFLNHIRHALKLQDIPEFLRMHE